MTGNIVDNATSAPVDNEKAEAEKKPRKKRPDFSAAVAEKGVIGAQAGQIVATVDMNSVSVPVLRMSIVNWVGTSPLEVTADSIKDIRKVLDDLEDQAR